MSNEPYERKNSYSFWNMLQDYFGSGSGHLSSSSNSGLSEDDGDNSGDSSLHSPNEWDLSKFEKDPSTK